MSDADTESSSTSRSTSPFAATPSSRRSSTRSARSTSSRRPTAGVEVVEENLDECVLCNLCVDASPDGTVTVLKLYDGTTL